MTPLDSEARARFSSEAATSASVKKSPYVVQVLDHGALDSGEPFIVMELLVGSDLAAHLARHGAMPLPETKLASMAFYYLLAAK